MGVLDGNQQDISQVIAGLDEGNFRDGCEGKRHEFSIYG
jgi:hypothetical protein